MDSRIGTLAELTHIDRDIAIENHGSIILVRPISLAGEQWISDNVSSDALYFAGALVVEPRYLDNLVEGMRAAYLVVEVG